MFTRGVLSSPIFLDEDDRATFVAILDVIVRRFGWKCYAYCLLTTHYHVLFETPDANVSAGMQQLNGLYGTSFNRKHGRRGHVFESRFESKLVESDAHLIVLFQYIALNPVRTARPLCARPQDWRWSSYRASAGYAPAPPFLDLSMLEIFHQDETRARHLLRDFVERPLPDDRAA